MTATLAKEIPRLDHLPKQVISGLTAVISGLTVVISELTVVASALRGLAGLPQLPKWAPPT